MTARQVKIRNGVYDAITSTDFTSYFMSYAIEKTYYPQENLEDLSDKPKIKVVGMNIGSERNRDLRKPGALVLEIPVQVCIQQKVNPNETLILDNLVEFCEAVMAACEDDELVLEEDYLYQRTEPLKDENDLELSYEQMTVEGVFQCIFTVYYQTIKES